MIPLLVHEHVLIWIVVTEAHIYSLFAVVETGDEDALWTFMLGLRQIFADFKKVQPIHAVFVAIETLLDARRSTWERGRSNLHQVLALKVDEYRAQGVDGEGADAEF